MSNEKDNSQYTRALREPLVSSLVERTRTLEALNAELLAALELAAVRLEILTARLRGCHEETGRHQLLPEAEAFCLEARTTIAKAKEKR